MLKKLYHSIFIILILTTLIGCANNSKKVKYTNNVSYTYYPNGSIKSSLQHGKIPISIEYRKDGTKKSFTKWFHTDIRYHKNGKMEYYLRMDSDKGLWTSEFFTPEGKMHTNSYEILKNFKETITLTSRIGINGNSELIKVVKHYNKGKLDGIVRKYYQGNLSAEIPYINGIKNGIEIHYNDKKIISKIPYTNGQINGLAKEYITINNKHQLWSEVPYINGNIDGVVKRYNKNEVSLEVPYHNNQKDGLCKVYYYEDNNGEKNSIRYEIPFNNNKAEGIGKQYFKNGDIYIIMNFKDGIAINAKYGPNINETINNSEAYDFAKTVLFHCNITMVFKFQ
jgi:antitoxin component YwqK of YwqJK toxin-antitoxin module